MTVFASTDEAREAGRAACREVPPRQNGLLMTRPLGLNPCDLWTDEHDAWDDGYAEEAAAQARRYAEAAR